MKFSIIIPALNEEKYLPLCLESVKKQKGGFVFEIIVIDNASTDKTFQVAQSAGVKVLNEPKKGVGQARKTGTEIAKGEYILHLDADTRLPEDHLLKIAERFNFDNELVCVGGQFYFYDANLFWRVLRTILFPFFFVFAKITLGKKMGPMGNDMAFKLSTYKQTTGFDASLKYGEDFDLNRKLSEIGKIKLDPKLKFFISSRRYKFFEKDFWIYAANFFNSCFTGKAIKNELVKR